MQSKIKIDMRKTFKQFCHINYIANHISYYTYHAKCMTKVTSQLSREKPGSHMSPIIGESLLQMFVIILSNMQSFIEE